MIDKINKILSEPNANIMEVLPHYSRLKTSPYIFKNTFGLKKLPLEPGILLIRGARQYGKSTWLEEQIYQTIHEFGAGSAFYLNGDNLLSADKLEEAMEHLVVSFLKTAPVRRLFIDEITAIPHWEIVLKKMVDRGALKNVLVVTTGSKATDLRRGSERLPGRKGKLDRTTYLFTPISYHEFHRVCSKVLGNHCLIAYLLSGGSPVACAELAAQKCLPEYVIELVRDWIDGEIAETGRSKASLFNIMQMLYRFAGTPLGQAKLARETNLGNNTTVAGYMEILNDLGCVIPAFPWDQHKKLLVLRKPCKYHFTNLLAGIVYQPNPIRSVKEFLNLAETEQGIWYEWLVAQELCRRTGIAGKEILAPQAFWQNEHHEIDFVDHNETFIEVKRGKCSPLEFTWFNKQFPKQHLTIINTNRFETDYVRGITLEDFLLEIP